jgi:hypothetical protein
MLLLTPLAAAAVSSLAEAAHRRWPAGAGVGRSRLEEYTSGRFWTVVLSCLACVLLPVSLVFTSIGARPPEANLADALPSGCRLFSAADIGGPIVLLRPDVSVWADGRADFYGREHLLSTPRVLSGAEPIPSNADCIMLQRGGTYDSLVDRVELDSAWELVSSGGEFGVWKRR